jgi:hypothetical protein
MRLGLSGYSHEEHVLLSFASRLEERGAAAASSAEASSAISDLTSAQLAD